MLVDMDCRGGSDGQEDQTINGDSVEPSSY